MCQPLKFNLQVMYCESLNPNVNKLPLTKPEKS